MARSQRRRGASALRRGLLIYLERIQRDFPFDRTRTIEHVRAGGAIQLDTATVFSAMHAVDPTAARSFGFHADRENRRRFLLDAEDNLTEIDPKEPS